jgi:hypothetical protein
MRRLQGGDAARGCLNNIGASRVEWIVVEPNMVE